MRSMVPYRRGGGADPNPGPSHFFAVPPAWGSTTPMRLPVNAKTRNGSGGPTAAAGRRPGQDHDASSPRRVCLRGDLDQISLPTLLTVLDMERVSGVVEIWRNDQMGTLWLRAGRVV